MDLLANDASIDRSKRGQFLCWQPILYLQLVHLNQSTLVIGIETVSHEMFDENGI